MSAPSTESSSEPSTEPTPGPDSRVRLTPRRRTLLLIVGVVSTVALILVGLVVVRNSFAARAAFAPPGWYYSRFDVESAGGGRAPGPVRDAAAEVELSRLQSLGVRQRRIRMIDGGFVLAVPPAAKSLLAALSDAPPTVELRAVTAISRPAGRCRPGRVSPDGRALIRCGRDGATYTVASTGIGGGEVRTARVTPPRAPGGSWTVLVTLTVRGSAHLADLTRRLVGQPPPRNRMATMIDDSVVSAATVLDRITGGSLEISGSYTQAQAKNVAAPFVAAAAHVRVQHESISSTPP